MTTPTQNNSAGRPLDSPAIKKSGKNFAGHTFLVTLSPKEDISEISIQKFLKWAGKNSQYLYVVLEHGANHKLHLHACLAFETPRSKLSIHDDVWKRIVKPEHQTSIGTFAVLVTNMWNHEWYNTYLKKEEGVRILANRYDVDSVTLMFPTLEQQQQHLKATAGKRVSDSARFDHEQKYLEMFSEGHSFSTTLLYFRTRMFKTKDMMVIQDERRVHQLAMALYRYVTQILS
jgi:hypothetical protein